MRKLKGTELRLPRSFPSSPSEPLESAVLVGNALEDVSVWSAMAGAAAHDHRQRAANVEMEDRSKRLASGNGD